MDSIILIDLGEDLQSMLGVTGTLITVDKHDSGYRVNHLIGEYSEVMTGSELIDFYCGRRQMELSNHTIVDLRIYPQDMKPTLKELDNFMKDEKIKELVYLASPYSHPDADVVEQNFRDISKVSAEMTADGLITISPITYGHTLLQFKDMPGDWEFWTSFCLSILDKCDKIVVVKMTGWDKSSGIAGELDYAKENGIPIEYIDPEEYLNR